MRAAGFVVALAATFNLAIADVVCKSEAVHFKPRITTASEKAGFARSIDELCDVGSSDKTTQSRFESTLFSITSHGEVVDANACKVHFNHIIDECLAGKNMGGGSCVIDGLTLEVSVDASSEAEEAVVKRAKPAATKTATKKAPAKTPAKTPTKPGVKPTPTPTPAGKACPIKPGMGGKPGKKTLRSLISKILGRASPTKPGSPSSSLAGCDLDEPMAQLPGWGETWFGFRDEFSVSAAQLLKIAMEAYDEVKNKHPTVLVAALYVKDQGVFLGTVPHGTGQNKMATECPRTAPTLWSVLEQRTTKDKNKSQSKYHAEDAAMWHAYTKVGGVTGGIDRMKVFPKGSLMLTYGKLVGAGQATKIDACSEESASNIDPHCKQTMRIMGVTAA